MGYCIRCEKDVRGVKGRFGIVPFLLPIIIGIVFLPFFWPLFVFFLGFSILYLLYYGLIKPANKCPICGHYIRFRKPKEKRRG